MTVCMVFGNILEAFLLLLLLPLIIIKKKKALPLLSPQYNPLMKRLLYFVFTHNYAGRN